MPDKSFAQGSRDNALQRSQSWLQRWRWPFAWGLACTISCGMLAVLGARQTAQTLLQDAVLLSVRLNDETEPSPATAPELPLPGSHHKKPGYAKAEQSADATVRPAAQTLLTTPLPPTLAAAPASVPAQAGSSQDAPRQSAEAGNSPSAGNIENRGHQTTPSLAKADTEPAAIPAQCPNRVEPVFPSRARDDDIWEGRVLARLYLDKQGRVERVEILSAEPAGYFEREVRRAALQWRCDAASQSGSLSLKVPFLFHLK